MASEVVKMEPRKAPVQTGNAVSAMVPTNVEQAWRLAEIMAGSGMTPKSYGNDARKIMVGMMAGMEVGLTPFAALQSIAVIGNNPSIWGDGALALVQASNLVEDMSEQDDGHTAICTIKRTGRATPIVGKFSMDDAKKAGLAGKAGPWSQYPARMRQMRARAFALRDGFADVLKGLRVAEEVRDYSDFADAKAQPVQSMDGPSGRALLAASLADDETQSTEAEPELPAAILPEQAPAESVAVGAETPSYDPNTGEIDQSANDPRIAARDKAVVEFETAGTVIDLNSRGKRYQETLDAMPEEMGRVAWEAFHARMAILRGVK